MPHHPHVEDVWRSGIEREGVEVSSRQPVRLVPAPPPVPTQEQPLAVGRRVKNTVPGIPGEGMDILPAEPGGREPPAEAAVLAAEQAEVSPGEERSEVGGKQERVKVATRSRESEELKRLRWINGASGRRTLMGALMSYGRAGGNQPKEQAEGAPPGEEAGSTHARYS